MDKKNLVSIVVPVYNGGKFIGRCIDSVQAQTYLKWELILIDDGSADDTYEKIQKYSALDDRIIGLHTENRGVCSARNQGINMSRGNYLMFLDADDELEQCAVEKMLAVLKDKNCDIAIGQCTRIKEDGQAAANKNSYTPEMWENEEAIRHCLSDHPATYSVWGKLYRREIIGNTRFVEGRKIHEDSFFLFQVLLKNPKVVVSNECVYKYHITEGSASRTVFSEKHLDIRYFAEKKKEIIEQEYKNLTEFIPNMMIKANMALLWILLKERGNGHRELEKECIEEIVRYKDKFKPATNENKRWFFIITHHLYMPYKILRILLNK